jgi:hypothetical protein
MKRSYFIRCAVAAGAAALAIRPERGLSACDRVASVQVQRRRLAGLGNTGACMSHRGGSRWKGYTLRDMLG